MAGNIDHSVRQDIRDIRDFMARMDERHMAVCADIQEIKLDVKALNGTVRGHGEKLAAHDTYIGLTGLGGVGGILAGLAALLKSLFS